MGIGVLTGGVLAALLSAWIAHHAADEPPGEPLFTRSGALARWDGVVAFSLSRMHSYLSMGVPSELVRERILSARLAEAIGRDGRASVANVLDYAHDVMEQPRPSRRTRKRFFRAVKALNQLLADRGLPFIVYASFDWDDEYRAVDQVRFDALAITAVHRYRVTRGPGSGTGSGTGEMPDELRVLHVQRLGPARAQKDSLGFTAPEYDDAFVLPERIASDFERGLLAVSDARASTPLFPVDERTAEAPWYQAFRAHLAAVFAEELGDPAALSVERATSATLDAVEVHELQHQIDFKDKRTVRGVFRAVAERVRDMRLASACVHETSAHLGQLARERVMPRLVLAEIASYAFADPCTDANCLAALVILDELAAELGHAESGALVAAREYELSIIASRYVDITRHSSAEVAFAARQAWTRLFEEPLVELERID